MNEVEINTRTGDGRKGRSGGRSKARSGCTNEWTLGTKEEGKEDSRKEAKQKGCVVMRERNACVGIVYMNSADERKERCKGTKVDRRMWVKEGGKERRNEYRNDRV